MTDIRKGDRVATDNWADGTYEGVVKRVDEDSVYVHWNGSFAEDQMDPTDVRLVERAS